MFRRARYFHVDARPCLAGLSITGLLAVVEFYAYVCNVWKWNTLGAKFYCSSSNVIMCAVCAQATDEELQRAHTAEHVRHISGPRKDDDWLMGDNFYSELTPVAARYAAGCSVQVPCLLSDLP